VSAACRLAGKVAIVTGAGSQPGPGVGIGKAIGTLFARAGARVCLVDLDPDRADLTRAAIVDEGGEAFVVGGDVTSSGECERIVGETCERYGGLDVLVNNVGIVPPFAPLHLVEEAVWQRVLTVNLTSAFLMAKAVLPKLIERGGGSIVNIASTGAMVSTGLTPAYGATKAGLIRLTADLAVAYGRQGVRANAVAPGNVTTPLAAAARAVAGAALQAPSGRPEPLGTEGDAWDVAWASLFLASDEARWITGACLPVDAGLTQINPSTASALIHAG
jgi:NAD(P)-dependent dehydrogenase (short-subunit alcohol dehydrogenase family)